jgi:hypothetical protein
MKRKILGDYQTPLALAYEVVSTLGPIGEKWSRVLEPTCGVGNFIQAVMASPSLPSEVVGIELQPHYVEQARKKYAATDLCQVNIIQANIFDVDLVVDLAWQTQGPILVIGNPPWVTNAAMGAMEGHNLPFKSNLKRLPGIEAITGAANFDIAEFIWLKLMQGFSALPVTFALLCKTSVARNVLRYAHTAHVPIAGSTLRRIDAQRWFNAAVDACLFTVELRPGAGHYQTTVFSSLSAVPPETTMGYVGQKFVADVEAYQNAAALDGHSLVKWRSGIKHDAAPVLELTEERGIWYNGLGESVIVEEAYIFPLVKSADVQFLTWDYPLRGVIVPQKTIREDIAYLRQNAPLLWRYLSQHSAVFAARKSSIYRNKPPFSVFGLGDYSFAPYKVIVSGLYKTPLFAVAGPRHDRPTLCDDTCYLLAFDSLLKAALVASALNHPVATRFIKSILFEDAKRPITVALLERIRLEALIRSIPETECHDIVQQTLRRYCGELSITNSHDQLTALRHNTDWLKSPYSARQLQLL